MAALRSSSSHDLSAKYRVFTQGPRHKCPGLFRAPFCGGDSRYDARLLEAPDISLIVPTLNEAANLPALAARVGAALAGRRYELLIVDDNSRDNTAEVCRDLSAAYPLRLITRTEPKNGLSGAVLAGMAEARGGVLAVMDADLQHPPEKLPELIAPLDAGSADFCLGSRYAAGGSIETGWTIYRRLNSNLATLLARPFAGKVSDPMSGFFALRRDTYSSAKWLTPLGYKIALELLCKCRVKRVKEVPIHFGKRQAGKSKLSFKEQFRYLEHLSRLYDFSFPRLVPILKFLIVTALSWILAAVVFVLTLAIGALTWASASMSYLAAIAVTAVFHSRYVRAQREFLVRHRPWRDFLLSSLAEWVACTATAVYLSERANVSRPGEIFVIALVAALAARYVLRKELLLDVRGLRHELRKEEML